MYGFVMLCKSTLTMFLVRFLAPSRELSWYSPSVFEEKKYVSSQAPARVNNVVSRRSSGAKSQKILFRCAEKLVFPMVCSIVISASCKTSGLWKIVCVFFFLISSCAHSRISNEIPIVVNESGLFLCFIWFIWHRVCTFLLLLRNSPLIYIYIYYLTLCLYVFTSLRTQARNFVGLKVPCTPTLAWCCCRVH